MWRLFLVRSGKANLEQLPAKSKDLQKMKQKIKERVKIKITEKAKITRNITKKNQKELNGNSGTLPES